MARKPANPRARCRAHGGGKLELRTYAMYLTPFPAPDGKSGYGGVRPVAQSSQMPPIAPGRRCRAECERAPRVKQHATRPGLGGGTAPGAGSNQCCLFCFNFGQFFVDVVQTSVNLATVHTIDSRHVVTDSVDDSWLHLDCHECSSQHGQYT